MKGHTTLKLAQLPNADELVEFNPVNQVYLSSNEKYSFGPYRSSVSVKLCIEGSETYWINGQKKTLRRNEYMIVDDQSEVSYQTEERNLGYSIFADKTFSSDGLITNTVLCVFDVFGSWMLDSLHMGKMKDNFLQSVKSQLFHSHQALSHNVDRISRVRRSTKLELTEKIARAIKYMHENSREPFDLNAISDAACMSKFQFARFFKELHQMTPWVYFQELRMKEAMHLIQSERLTINELSEIFGFSQSSSFARSFKQFSGYSPSYFYNSNQRID